MYLYLKLYIYMLMYCVSNMYYYYYWDFCECRINSFIKLIYAAFLAKLKRETKREGGEEEGQRE